MSTMSISIVVTELNWGWPWSLKLEKISNCSSQLAIWKSTYLHFDCEITFAESVVLDELGDGYIAQSAQWKFEIVSVWSLHDAKRDLTVWLIR